MDHLETTSKPRPVAAGPARRSEAQPRPAVLCLLPGIPFPNNTGGTQRTLTLLRALDAHYDLTVLTLHRPGQDAAALRAELQGRLVAVPFPGGVSAAWSEARAALTGKPVNYARYAPAALAAALEAELKARPYELVHFDHLHTAQLLPLVRKLQPQAKAVIDEHNVEAQILERMAPLASWHVRQFLRWQAPRLRRLEAGLVSGADLVLACSSLDAQQLESMGAPQVAVVPNAAIFEPAPLAQRPERKDVLYVGSFDWWPNIDAAEVLAREIWPRCQDRLGDARLMIVGRNPPDRVKALHGGRVVVTGGVPSVAPYLYGARASAVPLRAGSGTRLKILEAWAYGVPVVSTRLGAEGLPVRDGENALLAETPAEFAEALGKLWSDPALAERIGKAGQATALDFAPDRIGAKLAALYGVLLKG